MAMISLEEAAKRLGVATTTIREWGEQGLLTIDFRMPPSNAAAGVTGFSHTERYVEEEQLAEVAESLGWLFLSAGNWEGPKES
jgi:hypothetical protein